MSDEFWFRNKITWFSFIFSILVVWVHSANGELFLGQSSYVGAVVAFQRFLGNTIAQIAVPGFFMMSGYLFYRNFSWKKLGMKWESRIHSLLIPFLLWNTIYYIGYVIGSHIPLVTDVVGKGIVPFDWFTAVDAVLHYTYNYVFWYLYQLILLTILAPVLYGVMKHTLWGLTVIMVLFYFAGRGTIIPYLNLDALLYYSLGGLGGLHSKDVIEGQWSAKRGAAGAGIWMAAIGFLIFAWPTELAGRVCYRALTPVGLWLLVDERRLPKAKEYMQYNFFLYAVHFAAVRLINKTAARILGGYWLVPVVLFTIMPGVMVLFSSVAGAWLKKRMPLMWTLLNGGR